MHYENLLLLKGLLVLLTNKTYKWLQYQKMCIIDKLDHRANEQ